MSSSNGEQECHACKLFVGGLHLETNNDSLRAYFEKYGEVCDAVVMIDGDTKKSRGFGFITFSDVSQAEVCLHKDNLPHYIDEKQVEVKMAVPKPESRPVRYTAQRTKKVFLGGISPDTVKEDIMEALKDFGIIDAQVMTEKGTEKPRGFGFAIFENFEAAEKVCAKKYFEIKDRKQVEAKKAQSQDEIRRTTAGGDHSGGPEERMPRGDAYGRDPYWPRGGGYHKMDVGGFPRGYADYYMREYGPGYGMGGGYDRAAAAAAYGYGGGYGRYPAQGYDVAAYASFYGQGPYGQSASAYGPSRGYAASGDKDRERGSGRGTGGFHPYRR